MARLISATPYRLARTTTSGREVAPTELIGAMKHSEMSSNFNDFPYSLRRASTADPLR